LDPGEFDKHRGERALTAVTDVVVAGVRNLGISQFFKNPDNHRKSRHGAVDRLDGLLPSRLGRVTF
jgi:hypothetical protein